MKMKLKNLKTCVYFSQYFDTAYGDGIILAYANRVSHKDIWCLGTERLNLCL